MHIIERLQQNKEAFGLLSKELRDVAEKIGTSSFQWFAGYGNWEDKPNEEWFQRDVYRLHADYLCPHPETETDAATELKICKWCHKTVQPERKMGWVEYPIIETPSITEFLGIEYSIQRGTNWSLYCAGSLMGFGGVKYKAPCDCTKASESFMGQFFMAGFAPCEKHGPYVPVMVRFWEEKK